MPELPEVEAFKNIVAQCTNKKITQIAILDSRVIKKISTTTFKKNLIGSRFTSVHRRGKYLVIATSTDKKLIMHFGLTGFVVLSKPDQSVRFSCVNFSLSNKKVLHWADIRKFGRLYLVDNADEIQGIKDLGPDALALSFKEFQQLVSTQQQKNVKAFLMDQSIIAGIGNEYSDEILFQAGIDPHHRLKDLSPAAIKKIYEQIKKVLNYAISVRKKDISKGEKVTMQNIHDFKTSYLQAHRHTDGKCPKNPHHNLKKVTIAGRSAYYCPIDQK
jgi:formamidopyrimidine-DNA glycosylase